MFNETIRQPGVPRRVYYSTDRNSLILLIGFAAVWGVLSAFWFLTQFQWLDVVGLISAIFSITVGYARFTTTRLVTTPAGIEYTTLGYHVRTTWDNAERIAVVRMWYSVERHGLILRYSALQGRPGGWWITPLYKQGRMIPLLSGRWCNYTALEQELRQYAPHLFA